MTVKNDLIAEIADIQKFLRGKNSRVHLLGICGIGMAGLAFILKSQGFEVSGCDSSPSHLAAWLRKRGIPALAGHDPSHVLKTDLLIRSSAVPENNPELEAARKAGKKIFRRGLVLAAICSAADSICVSGTHGKTTTSAMLIQLLDKAGLKPSFCIGGEVASLGGVAGFSTLKNIVLEADESDGTLGCYKPFISVITNIEFDHAEYFRDFNSLKKCFAQMARKTRRKVIYCFDDKASRQLLHGVQNAVPYGFSSGADLRVTKWKDTPNGLVFSMEHDRKPLGQIRLPMPGRHNALNAAAACAVGLELGIPFADIARALAGFQPVARRFERIIETKDLLVISDYAHHPSEVAALLSSTRALKRKRLLAVFQPHRYSRTKVLGKNFPPAFHGVNELVLCPVYEAWEAKIPGGTSWDLYEQFRQYNKIRTFCASSLRQAWDYLKTTAAPGDGILIIGAGDVEKIGVWAKTEIAPRLCGFKQLKLKNSPVRFNEPMASKTTLRVGGSADIYVEALNLSDLELIVRWAAKKSIPLRMIGEGSNVLISDLGVRGIVVRLKGTAWQNISRESDNKIVVAAGVSLQKLTAWTAQHGLTGAEFLTGIPGTIGGAIRMNAGAFGKEIGDIVAGVKVMEEDGTSAVLDQAQLFFAYRGCAGLKNRIVLEATLRLGNEKTDVIRQRMNQIRARRSFLKGLRSAGSIFRNPEGDAAGRLIEKAGLKGRSIGRAKISEQHANIIVTDKGAQASDVLALIEIARYVVRMKYGVDLTPEVESFE